jgi:mannose-6-phosphate isomerase-like protein (cupin superfamily)
MLRFASPAVLRAGQVHEVAILGARIVVRAGAADTGGAATLLDYYIPPAFGGPPVHVHPSFDEIFAVLDGTLTMRVGEETAPAGPGDTVIVPGSVPHTFANLSDAPVRVMIVVTPGGFEPYFDEIAAHLAAGPPDPAFVAELSARYGLENIGPPLSAPPA